jgi:hypothetical protein
MQNGRMHTYRLFSPNRQVVGEAPTEIQDRKQNVIGASKKWWLLPMWLDIWRLYFPLLWAKLPRGQKETGKMQKKTSLSCCFSLIMRI